MALLQGVGISTSWPRSTTQPLRASISTRRPRITSCSSEGRPAPRPGAGDQLGVELCGIAADGDINEPLRIDLDVTPVSWAFMWQCNGLLNRGQILRSMGDFADEVLPEFGGLGGGAQAYLRHAPMDLLRP